MAEIRAVEVIARKWASVTPQRSADYEAGVKDPRVDWATKTANSADAWKTGVQGAIQRDGFAKGVRAAGTSRWQEGAVGKGVQRWGPGVALAEDRYRDGFAPFADAIRRVTLPPRFARRDPRNLARVAAVVAALVDAKTKAV